MQNYKHLFPIFKNKINQKELIYLDSAATSQIAEPVLNEIINYETHFRANVHRGVHTLGDLSTSKYQESREKIAKFINANVPDEVVFTKNSTDSMNLVALSYVRHNLTKGDVLLVSEAEHHSNFIEWQEMSKEIGFDINLIPVKKDGSLDYKNIVTNWDKVKFVTFNHVSNVLGYVNDVKEIVSYIKKKSKQSNASELPKFCIDASQSISHIKIDVQSLGIDFLAFSGHKMYGPMGIGILWVNRNLHNQIFPTYYGGGMVREVNIEGSINKYSQVPELLEAGTPNVSGAVGIAKAAEFILEIGYQNIHKLEQEILEYAYSELQKLDAEIYGPQNINERSGLIAFNIPGIPSHDLATIVDQLGVEIRSGQHCVMPWHMKNSIVTTARLSVGIYNEKSDIDLLIAGINNAKKILQNKDG